MEDQSQKKATDKALKKYETSKYDTLVQQVQAEYNLCWLHQNAKITQQLERLKLYNNQKRDMSMVGDNLLFTVHQTVLASLYSDVLSTEFVGREEGDSDTADNLTSLAKYDDELVDRDIHDYMWDWDTLFFSRGLTLLQEFNRDPAFMCPIPELIDPMTFLRDPRATSVKGDMKRRGGMRFGGREIYISKTELTAGNGYFDTNYLRSDIEINSLLAKAGLARDDAQNLNTDLFNREIPETLGDNAVIPALQWFTNWKGKPCMAIFAKQRTRIIKYVPLDFAFPIIDRPMYPHSHDWAGTSIPDLTEDKQRQKSVAINLGLNAMKSNLYPHYLYDTDRIKNKADLLKFGFNKFTGVGDNEGRPVGNAVMPLNKVDIRMDMVNFVLNSLDASAQKATATPDMQQGTVSDQKRTLGELNLVSSHVDTRYSLTARVFGWSEREYRRQWYWKYKKHFLSELDTKIIRINGSLMNKWRTLTKSNIVTQVDPDIYIESKIVQDQNRTRERVLLQTYGNLLFTLEPTANKRFFLRKLAKLNNFSRDDVDLLLPPTPEELKALKENDQLNANKLVIVQLHDDHVTHIEVNGRAADTPATRAHLAAHIEAMSIIRGQPDLLPQHLQPGQQQGQPAQGQQPQLSGKSQAVGGLSDILGQRNLPNFGQNSLQ